MNRLLRALILPVLACGFALPATAQAATRPAYPVITGVSPIRLAVGERLVIRGRNFIPGRFTNVVVFQRVRARAVFVRADRATRSTITMMVPGKLLPFLNQRAGVLSPTRFRLRILARHFGLAFTSLRLSPVIGPLGTGRVVPPPSSTTAGLCHPNPSDPASDVDGDLIPDAVEIRIHTDPCNPDTDGDGVDDGYEYYSALDLNSRALPYPGKRPYPNPLDRSDAGIDHDGDGLTEFEEYSAWSRYFPHTLMDGHLAAYSDGNQATQGLQPVPPGEEYLNTDSSCSACSGSGGLTDDELDVDGDGIGNWDEIRGAFDASNVKHMAYKPTLDWLDPDTDGDGVPDGADDQDHDDVPNAVELRRDDTGYHVQHRFDSIASNPMDPCDPNINSRTCPLHPEH